MILFISHDASRTGAPIGLLHVLNWFRNNTKYDFEILLKQDGVLAEDFKKIAVTHMIQEKNIFYRVSKKMGFVKESNFSIPRELKNKKFKLIYSNTITNGLLVSKLNANCSKVITHVHEMDSWIELSGKENWKAVIGQTNQYIAVSKAVKDVLIRRCVDKDIISLIPECASSKSNVSILNSEQIRKSLGIQKDSFVVVGGGAEMWRKGRDLFVQLAACVNRVKDDHDYHFIWLGVNEDKEAQMWFDIDLRNAGCFDKVHWVGNVNNPGDYLLAGDIFAMVSREDPMPLIAIEAGMYGLPIVCFDNAGGTAEWVNNQAGFCVDYLNVYEMSSAIKKICNNMDLRKSLSISAKKITHSMHSVNAVSSSINKVVINVLSD